MIDRELVTRKIVRISGDLEELRKLDSAGLEAYLADPYKEILAERPGMDGGDAENRILPATSRKNSRDQRANAAWSLM